MGTTYSKPAVRKAWGESNTTSADMFDPGDTATGIGWTPSTTTPPSRQRFNWAMNWVANAIRYFMQRGVADWDAAETYAIGGLTLGSDNNLYRSSVASNINFNPTTQPTKWERISWSQANLDARYLQLSNVATQHVALADLATNATNSTNATNATNASTAAQTPWSGITGKPTTRDGFGITDVPKTDGTGAAGSWNINAYPRRSDGTAISFIYSGVSGTPTYVWGTNDGVNVFVYQPANFSVNFANAAASVPFSGITSKPTTVAGYGITDGITTGNIGSQSVNFANSATNAANAAFATNAGSAASSTNSTNSVNATNATNATNSTTQIAGTSNTTIATTQFACPGFSHGANGYDKRPSGLIDQWGTVTIGDIPTGGPFTTSVTFPISFPVALYNLQVTVQDLSNYGDGGPLAYPGASNVNGFTLGYREISNGLQNVVVHWRAKGK